MYRIDVTVTAGRRKPIVIDVDEAFTLKKATLEKGKGLTFVSVHLGDEVLFNKEMSLVMAINLLNIRAPTIPKGELRLVVRNPSTQPIELVLKIE